MRLTGGLHPPSSASAEALYVNGRPTHSQQEYTEQTVVVRGQDLKVKYVSIVWMKDAFVQQWALNDIEARRGEKGRRKRNYMGRLKPLHHWENIVYFYDFLLEDNQTFLFVAKTNTAPPIANSIWLIQLTVITIINIAKSSYLCGAAFSVFVLFALWSNYCCCNCCKHKPGEISQRVLALVFVLRATLFHHFCTSFLTRYKMFDHLEASACRNWTHCLLIEENCTLGDAVHLMGANKASQSLKCSGISVEHKCHCVRGKSEGASMKQHLHVCVNILKRWKENTWRKQVL